MVEVKLCLGSSCFARGNGDMLRFLQSFILQRGLDVKLVGCRCLNCCCEGPNLFIDGKKFSNVDQEKVVELIEKACAGE